MVLGLLKSKDSLHLIGRSSPNDKRGTVTNAKRWESYHNYGLAFDISIIYDDGSYEKNGDKLLEIIKQHNIIKLAEKYGFEWGGHFKDYPHFQMKFNHSHQKLRKKIIMNIKDDKYPIIDDK